MVSLLGLYLIVMAVGLSFFVYVLWPELMRRDDVKWTVRPSVPAARPAP